MPANANATAIVRAALAGSGVELVASCGIDRYDARAPPAYRSDVLFPGARGLVVVGSAGPRLWRELRASLDPEPSRWGEPHPLDGFVRGILARADAALAGAGVPSRRFEAAFHAEPRLAFVALAQLVGLGFPGPFGMLIHPEHGPWWALRGAFLVDAEVEAPLTHRPPCEGCPAPCVGGWANAGGMVQATAEARGRCVVGVASRYDDAQIAYHHDRAATVERLRAPSTESR
jgi:hypothetical protein